MDDCHGFYILITDGQTDLHWYLLSCYRDWKKVEKFLNYGDFHIFSGYPPLSYEKFFSHNSNLTSSNVRTNIATSLLIIATSLVKTRYVAMLSRDVATLE